MNRYRIRYYFDGYGTVEVDARSEGEASEIFYNGGAQSNEEEWCDGYSLDTVELLEEGKLETRSFSGSLPDFNKWLNKIALLELPT